MQVSYSGHRKPLGFTLIEVLLALSVFALAGVALLSTSETHFSSLNHIEEKMFANWVASNQLVEVNIEKQWPPKNNKRGKVELAGREWFWRQEVLETFDKNMRAVAIEVRMVEDSETPTARLMTYVSLESKQ